MHVSDLLLFSLSFTGVLAGVLCLIEVYNRKLWEWVFTKGESCALCAINAKIKDYMNIYPVCGAGFIISFKIREDNPLLVPH